MRLNLKRHNARIEHWMRLSPILILALTCGAAVGHTQADPKQRSWNRPVTPFRIMGNIYYVGASDITSFLITTPQGEILLDGGFPETAPQIEANIERLGFHLADVKILLNSHAHFDHAGSLAELKRRTGATLVASEADAPVLAAGGAGDFFFGDRANFPAVKPDQIIRDGEAVSLGGATLTAHITAGHTKGCTTWIMNVSDAGVLHPVVFVCSTTVLPGYHLVANTDYPQIATDYAQIFRTLAALPCDVFLAAHGSFFDLEDKRAALARSSARNPFVDPQGYRDYVRRSQARFEAELHRQQEHP
jgi:metallo-beta-lactamase class B